MLLLTTTTEPATTSLLMIILWAAVIAVVGGIGVFAPWLAARGGNSSAIAYGNSFAGGVLLAAGLIHLLADANDGFGDAYYAVGRHRRYVAVEDSLFATPPPARETARGDVEGSAGFRSMFGRAIVPRSGLGWFLLWNARPFAHAR